ncbi:hypothetical protein RvY_13298 [Ramazzottius varieornatus]|uniref:Uncharacterized protein n=1 Tax=Ramazzottius varieornatus TaxID=947166 RepID=A0A1D1VUX1_RAMVA|nr:hypothetical protein RvY_13298 [Ramazzottius varieornatus]
MSANKEDIPGRWLLGVEYRSRVDVQLVVIPYSSVGSGWVKVSRIGEEPCYDAPTDVIDIVQRSFHLRFN